MAVLEPLGQNLVSARSGEEALRHVLNQDFALILLDVRMPDMDGFELAAAIKHRPRSRHIPIIFLTGVDADPYHALRGYSEGAVDYIAKPYDAWVLRSKVAVFVELDAKTQMLRRQAEALEVYNADLLRLTEAANTANAAKTTFLNMVGHELRTPLTVIMGYAAMLADRSFGELPEVTSRPLEIIQGKSAELGRLVDSLLAAARIEADVDGTVREPTDVKELVRLAVERGAGRVVLHKAILTVAIDEGAAMISDVDGRHIGHILDNLINNALTYSIPPVQIGLSATVTDGMITIRVTDNGPGIAAEHHQEIFERFVRATEPGNEPGGTGLGLYIARALAQRNGGDLSLECSARGAGATFLLSLPLVASA